MTGSTDEYRPRAVLIAIETSTGGSWSLEESLAELARLVDTAGGDVVGTTSQRLDAPHPATFIGSGKAEEVRQTAVAERADYVIFDDELNPRQQANLEKIFGEDVRVMDRTALILDIFALHAKTREGKLQVELATLEYELPRLRGMWSHLVKEKLGGGVGARFGTGESQLETDRRLARKRIATLKEVLRVVERQRTTQRTRRLNSGIYRVSLVGYTNAGKSTLLNALTGSHVLTYDKLFATLDSTTRQFTLPSGRETTLTDTVGFINKLPHELVAAFQSTLAEVQDADLLLHVVDAGSQFRKELLDAVQVVLQEIDSEKIDALIVWNKSDTLEKGELSKLLERYPGSVAVSALDGSGFEALTGEIERRASESTTLMQVLLPYTRGDLVQFAHEHTSLISESYGEAGTELTLRVPRRYSATFAPYSQEPQQDHRNSKE
ncbi:MAG: GTPase HflX [Coriobacteriia bacterium]|nr:GTPase HflX [Coriobacteriia bacterium]